VPTTFETRNTGAMLEVEAVVSPDGNAITLELSPHIVRLQKIVRFNYDARKQRDRTGSRTTTFRDTKHLDQSDPP
jgi:hypothetical protein